MKAIQVSRRLWLLQFKTGISGTTDTEVLNGADDGARALGDEDGRSRAE